MNKQEYELFKHSQIWKYTSKALRLKVGHCELCGYVPDNLYELNVHHVSYPMSDDYVDFCESANLVVLCEYCHNVLSKSVDRIKALKDKIRAENQQALQDELTEIAGEFYSQSFLRHKCDFNPTRPKDYSILKNIMQDTLRGQVDFSNHMSFSYKPNAVMRIEEAAYREMVSQGLSTEEIKERLHIGDTALARLAKRTKQCQEK